MQGRRAGGTSSASLVAPQKATTPLCRPAPRPAVRAESLSFVLWVFLPPVIPCGAPASEVAG